MPFPTPKPLIIRRVIVNSQGPIGLLQIAQGTAISTDPIRPRPLIRKVVFTKGENEGKLPRINRYSALPKFRLAAEQARSTPPEPPLSPEIRKIGAGVGPSGGSPKFRRLWVAPFEPFTVGLPFSPEVPIKMTAPGHQSNLDAMVAATEEGAAPGHQGNSDAMSAAARERLVLAKRRGRNLAVEGHRIERPDVKTTYVDTHCHLISTLQMLKDDNNDETIPQNALDIFVKTIFPPQVSAVVDIYCDLPLKDYHEKAAALDWPEHFKYYFSIGAHPHCAMSYNDEVHESLIKAMSHPSCVAWGECGLDYYKNHASTHPTQRTVFARQLTAAVGLGKPIVVHTRDADEDTLSIIQANVPKDHRLHMHCFTSGARLAREILKEYPNSFIGLTGVISYSGIDHINQLLRSGDLPVERILLETDSPYMVPKKAYNWLANERPQDKKKRFVVSHSGMIPFTADRIVEEINKGRRAGEEKEITLDEILDITRKNAAKMYGIDV